MGLGVRLYLLLGGSVVVGLTQIESHTGRGRLLHVLLFYIGTRVAVDVPPSSPLYLPGHEAYLIWIGSSVQQARHPLGDMVLFGTW